MKKLTIDSFRGKSVDEIKKTIKKNISAADPKINAYLEAFDIDKFEQGKGLLANIPFAVKDNILIKGMISSCASRMLADYKAPYSAFVIEKLLSEGAMITGRTNMDEFAMGSSTENSAFMTTKNPLNEEYVPGGSSGGSAAAVASGMCAFALGSDTGGSVRQPAAFCGIYGYKPTYGVFSRRGLVAYCSSFDQIGVLANSIEDIAMVSSVMNDKDPYDLTSYLDRELKELGKIKYTDSVFKSGIIGVVNTFEGIPVSPEIEASYKKLVGELRKMNLEVVNISPPFLEYAIPLYYVLSAAEAASNLARFDGVKYAFNKRSASYQKLLMKTRGEGFGREVKRRIMLGTFVTSSGYKDEFYKKANRLRTNMKKSYDALFSNIDYMLLPTTPTPPFKLGEKIDDPVAMYYSDAFTTFANIIGIPALSIPYDTDPKGLPIGMQVLSNVKRDVDLLTFCANLVRKLK